MAGHGTRRFVVLALALIACGSDGSTGPGADETPVPPPGPHFTVLPIPFDSLARVSPLGLNNKILPIGHTYWDTCDYGYLMNGGRPCLLARLPIRSPGNGVVRFIDAEPDGGITIEGPPGLHFSFAHVTANPALTVGDTVRAGDIVATMYYTHSFDFGVLNYGIENEFVRQERYPDGYIRAQSPLAQFGEPLRSQIISRTYTLADPYGRLSYDVEGTAAGNWFKPGTPPGNESFTPAAVHTQLFLGRLQERDETRIMVAGDRWTGLPNFLAVVDEADPSWDDITPSSGPVALRLWALSQDGRPKLDYPHGTVLVEVLGEGRLRIDWFDGHEAMTGFSSTARIYER